MDIKYKVKNKHALDSYQSFRGDQCTYFLHNITLNMDRFARDNNLKVLMLHKYIHYSHIVGLSSAKQIID